MMGSPRIDNEVGDVRQMGLNTGEENLWRKISGVRSYRA